MKHIKPINESDWWDSDPSAPWNQEPDPEPQRDQEMTESENLFKCLAFNSSFAILSKKGVRNELWVLTVEAVDDNREFADFREWFWESEDEKEYYEVDDKCIEWFSTAVYRGDYKGDKWLDPKEAVCEAPNRALKAFEDGPEFLIRISGGLAQYLIEDFASHYSRINANIHSNAEYRKRLREMISLVSKVYPEGRLLPGEDPVEDPEA